MCIDINLTIRAFVYHINEGQLGPQQYLSTFSSPASLTDNTIYGLQTLIGDAIVVCSFIHFEISDVLMVAR